MKAVSFLVLILSLTVSYADDFSNIRELPFEGSSPDGCERLHFVTGEGKTRENAKEEIYRAVISSGGNAVVFTSGAVTLNKETRKPEKHKEFALIYKCPD